MVSIVFRAIFCPAGQKTLSLSRFQSIMNQLRVQYEVSSMGKRKKNIEYALTPRVSEETCQMSSLGLAFLNKELVRSSAKPKRSSVF